MLESGNIKDCLQSSCDYNEWYIDKLGDLRCTAVHHDGVNHVIYEYMEQNGWTEETLLEIALKNDMFKENILLIPFESYALEKESYTRDDDLSFFSELSVPMVTVTNMAQHYGSSAILDKEVMAKIAEAFGEDLYIIPDSIHNCVVVPKSEYPEAELEERSSDKAHKKAHSEEWLSDDLYYFDRLTREITQFISQENRTKSPGVKLSEQCRK